MSEDQRNLKWILSSPFIYQAFQDAMSSKKGREIVVGQVISAIPGDRMLDVGCGPAGLLRYLPAGIDYVGVDKSAKYLAHARARFGNIGNFIEADVGSEDLKEEGPFDIITMLGLLHHLSTEEAQRLLTQVRDLLGPEGRLVTLDPVFVTGQNPIARFLVGNDRGKFVRTQESYLELARSAFHQVEGCLRQDILRVPYSHFIMQCRNTPDEQN